jgi:hypothetical protein
MTTVVSPLRAPPRVTAYQLDEIERCYGHEPTRKLAKRIGLAHPTINAIAQELGLRMSKTQRSRARSPYWRGTA